MYSKGAILRGMIADKKSPLVYGYEGSQMPVYFSNDPVLMAGRGGGAGGGGRGGGGGGGAARRVEGVGQDVTPNSVLEKLSPYQDDDALVDPYTEDLPTLDQDRAIARRSFCAAAVVAADAAARQEAKTQPVLRLAWSCRFPTESQ